MGATVFSRTGVNTLADKSCVLAGLLTLRDNPQPPSHNLNDYSGLTAARFTVAGTVQVLHLIPFSSITLTRMSQHSSSSR
jgi:hypothetical protein